MQQEAGMSSVQHVEHYIKQVLSLTTEAIELLEAEDKDTTHEVQLAQLLCQRADALASWQRYQKEHPTVVPSANLLQQLKTLNELEARLKQQLDSRRNGYQQQLKTLTKQKQVKRHYQGHVSLC